MNAMLRLARELAADIAFEEYDFGDVSLSGELGPWSMPASGKLLIRQLPLSPAKGDADTAPGNFIVEFHATDSALVAKVYAVDFRGVVIGRAPTKAKPR